MTILLCIAEFTKSADHKYSHQKEKKRKRQLCEVMDVLIYFMAGIFSQCMYMYQTQHCILYLSIITNFFKRKRKEDENPNYIFGKNTVLLTFKQL